MLHRPETDRERKKVSTLYDRGDVERLAPGLYKDSGASIDVVLQNYMPVFLEELVGSNARLSHRSTFSCAPQDDMFFVVSPDISAPDVRLVGLKKFYLLDGKSDPNSRKIIWEEREIPVSSFEQGLVEILEDRRGKFRESLVTDDERLEHVLYRFADQINLNKLRGCIERNEKQTGRMNSLEPRIKAIRNQDPDGVQSFSMKRKLSITGPDERRVRIFEQLADYFQESGGSEAGLNRKWSLSNPELRRNFSFLAAYFSNYVEGTNFPPEEAENIITRGSLPDNPPDEKTLIGTYKLYEENIGDGQPVPTEDFSECKEWLIHHHEIIAEGRDSLRPGSFKKQPNSAGSLEFVEPEKVEATLEAGLIEGERILDDFHRTLHFFFVLNEVHPFRDGNGRLARYAQDKSLINQGKSGLLVTMMNRDFYLRTLRDLSLQRGDTPERNYHQNLVRIYRRNMEPPLDDRDEMFEFARRETDETRSAQNLMDSLQQLESSPTKDSEPGKDTSSPENREK